MNEPQPGELLEREDVGAVTVLRLKVPVLRGDSTTDALFDQAQEIIEGGRAQIVLNLTGLVFLASLAIGRLVRLWRQTQASGGRLVLCNVAPTMSELLQITHLSEFLLVYENEQAALASFR